jgi:phosphatidylglycerol:prolipoprotein diacylglycerol transferase
MWPTLVSLGPVAIHSFGVFLFLGLFFGGFNLWKRGAEEGFDEEELMDGWLITIIASLVLARVAHILINWQSFAGNIYKMAFISKFPGLSFEGALVGAFLALAIFASKKKWSLWKFLDVSVFAVITVLIFGQVGSFLAGNNLGIANNAWLGLSFPGVEGKHLPLQLIWAFLLWLLLSILHTLEQKYRTFSWYQNDKDEAKPGFLIGAFFILFGLLRFSLNWLIAERSLIGIFALEQWWALILVVSGVLLILIRSGITIRMPSVKKSKERSENKQPLLNKNARKKIGFDFK